jgi:hypothetical protein
MSRENDIGWNVTIAVFIRNDFTLSVLHLIISDELLRIPKIVCNFQKKIQKLITFPIRAMDEFRVPKLIPINTGPSWLGVGVAMSSSVIFYLQLLKLF